MKKIILFCLLILVAGTAYYYGTRFRADNWEVSFGNLGSSSSPRAVDLNGDGILDIVVGAGYKEFEKTDKAVLALNGVDGSVLWKVPARNQVVGSADFQDVNGDSIPDVFIGGRSAVLFGIDGKTGSVLWEFMPDYPGIDIYNDTAVLNFYNTQFIDDINGDGLRDILTAYGGFIKAAPNDPNRPVGYLLVLNPLDGKILRKSAVPDGAEIYFSPVLHDFRKDGSIEVVYGTGGETLNGNLYRVPLSDLLNNTLNNSTLLAEGQGKGFVAPPVLSDVTGDGISDILVNAVNGRFICIDGSTNKKLWEFSLGQGFEIYTSPSPGRFTEDNTTDFFVSFGHGVWPEIDYAINILFDGSTGKPFYSDTTGTFQYASAVVYDVTGDDYPDVIFPTNTHAVQRVGAASISYLENNILIYDVKNRSKKQLVDAMIGTNIGSTPLLTDLDNDGMLDVIYCYMNDGTDSFSFKKMVTFRKELNVKIEDPILWGSYMGSAYDGIYRPNPK